MLTHSVFYQTESECFFLNKHETNCGCACANRVLYFGVMVQFVNVCQDIRAIWNGTTFLVVLVFAAFGLSVGLWRYSMFRLCGAQN